MHPDKNKCRAARVKGVKGLSGRGAGMNPANDGNPYNPSFRNADELVFTLIDAPEWLRVDENGKITGCPTQMGRCEVTIRVTRKQGGQDEQVYILDMTE